MKILRMRGEGKMILIISEYSWPGCYQLWLAVSRSAVFHGARVSCDLRCQDQLFPMLLGSAVSYGARVRCILWCQGQLYPMVLGHLCPPIPGSAVSHGTRVSCVLWYQGKLFYGARVNCVLWCPGRLCPTVLGSAVTHGARVSCVQRYPELPKSSSSFCVRGEKIAPDFTFGSCYTDFWWRYCGSWPKHIWYRFLRSRPRSLILQKDSHLGRSSGSNVQGPDMYHYYIITY